MTRFLVKEKKKKKYIHCFLSWKKKAHNTKATYCISHPTISRLRLYMPEGYLACTYMLIRYTPKKRRRNTRPLSLSPLIYFSIWNVWGPYKKKHNWLPSSSLRLDLLIILLSSSSFSFRPSRRIYNSLSTNFVCCTTKGSGNLKVVCRANPPNKKMKRKKKQSWRDGRRIRRMKDL